MRGTNTPLKAENLDGKHLSVKEIFYTLQGEGPFTGHPAVFVRLAGCNLKCYFCDTDFASIGWQPSVDEIVSEVKGQSAHHCDMVVITGGEPLRQNITPLVERLLSNGYFVQLETNGTYWRQLPDHDNLYIVCSPKTATLDEQMKERVDAFKYVIQADAVDPVDGLPVMSTQTEGVKSAIARPVEGKAVYVMPQDEFEDTEKTAANLKASIDIALKFGYRLTLQTHKVLNIR